MAPWLRAGDRDLLHARAARERRVRAAVRARRGRERAATSAATASAAHEAAGSTASAHPWTVPSRSRSWHDQRHDDLGGAHAVVTGGSSGIGLATARHAGGARRAGVAARPRRGRVSTPRPRDRSARSPTRVGRRGAAPMSRPRPRSTSIGSRDGLGPCDVLVTAAGSAHPGYFEQLDDVGLPRPDGGRLLRHAARGPRGGAVDDRAAPRAPRAPSSSTAGLIGVFGYSAYAPAKYAVRGLAETLRSELAPHGIVVACAYPPDTRTPGLDRRERAQAAGDGAHLRQRSSPARPTTWRGRSCAASSGTGSSSPPTSRPRRSPAAPGCSARTCAGRMDRTVRQGRADRA